MSSCRDPCSQRTPAPFKALPPEPTRAFEPGSKPRNLQLSSPAPASLGRRHAPGLPVDATVINDNRPFQDFALGACLSVDRVRRDVPFEKQELTLGRSSQPLLEAPPPPYACPLSLESRPRFYRPSVCSPSLPRDPERVIVFRLALYNVVASGQGQESVHYSTSPRPE